MAVYESKYLILTPKIAGLGGAQLYVARRANYLANNGYKVYIVIFEGGTFILKENFKNFAIINIPELELLPTLFIKRSKVDEIVYKVESFIGPVKGKLIIESHIPALSLWGEIIAQKLVCKHIIYFLSEVNLNSLSYRKYKSFFKAKLMNHELIGISSKSQKLIFGNDYDDNFNNFVNVPFDPNELPEKSMPSISFSKSNNEILIATLSRLRKPYIDPLIQSIISLASNTEGFNFKFVVAGDDINKEILLKLRNKYNGIYKNLEIIFTGYIHPVGKDFFKDLDIFVGMGTAVINSISQRCATITIDPLSSKASGILGLTTKNFAYSENDKLYEVNHLILKLIENRDLLELARERGLELFESDFNMKNTMKKLDSYALRPSRIIFEEKHLFSFSILYSTFLFHYSGKLYGFINKYMKKTMLIGKVYQL